MITTLESSKSYGKTQRVLRRIAAAIATSAWSQISDSTAYRTWSSICWSPELKVFCAVARGGGSTSNVFYSPNGRTWTQYTTPTSNSWTSVCWSPELRLFCAVAETGTGNRVMTSPDGRTWTTRTSAADSGWQSVCWAPELGLFVAVANSGTTRVMTSPDGITWTARTAAVENAWYSVCWSPDHRLLVAVAWGGSSPYDVIMSSRDGINWTSTYISPARSFREVCYVGRRKFFAAISVDTPSAVYVSRNGVDWTSTWLASSLSAQRIIWAPEIDTVLMACFSASTYKIVAFPDMDSLHDVYSDPQEWIVGSYVRTLPQTAYAINAIGWSPDLMMCVALLDNSANNYRIMISSPL